MSPSPSILCTCGTKTSLIGFSSNLYTACQQILLQRHFWQPTLHPCRTPSCPLATRSVVSPSERWGIWQCGRLLMLVWDALVFQRLQTPRGTLQVVFGSLLLLACLLSFFSSFSEQLCLWNKCICVFIPVVRLF